MGEGIERAREFAPEHAALMDNLKDQLLIVFLRRLNGKVSIPVGEIDDTEGVNLKVRVDKDKVFHFELEGKDERKN